MRVVRSTGIPRGPHGVGERGEAKAQGVICWTELYYNFDYELQCLTQPLGDDAHPLRQRLYTQLPAVDGT
ncbi:hypothetical protein FHT00_002074 [Sphingomonas insulae]|nr:hypothetical protein [Sphingomonas insulae]